MVQVSKNLSHIVLYISSVWYKYQMYLSPIVLIYQFCVVQVSKYLSHIVLLYQFCVVQVSNVSVTYCLNISVLCGTSIKGICHILSYYISSVWYKYQMYLSPIVLIYQFCVVQVSNVSVTYCLNISVLCGTSIKGICHILSYYISSVYKFKCMSPIVLIYQFCVVQVSKYLSHIVLIYQFCVVQVSKYLSPIVLIYQFCVVQVSNVSVTYCLNISVLCGTSIKCICHRYCLNISVLCGTSIKCICHILS